MIDERISRFPLRKSKGTSYREAGTGPALVCLHGIGAASAGWILQLESLKSYRLIAWDAPGYGESDFLPPVTRAKDSRKITNLDKSRRSGPAAGCCAPPL